MEKINLCSHFTSGKITTSNILQGILIEVNKKEMVFYATDLTRYVKTTVSNKNTGSFKIIVDPKKIGEFLNLLSAGNIDLAISEKNLSIEQGRARGSFPLIAADDFPLPPSIKEEAIEAGPDFFERLSLVTFASSQDSMRPALTSVNFVVDNKETTMVSTDGFRLSLIREKGLIVPNSMLIPADFLTEVGRIFKEKQKIRFYFLEKEKMVAVADDDTVFYSRLIDGDFPAFEKVIPAETKTTIEVDREEFLKNVKLVSIFAREQSNIVVFETLDRSVKLTPKVAAGDSDNFAIMDAQTKGETQRIAFNYKFLVDLLSRFPQERVIVEILRPDAPVVFRAGKNPAFLHVIMPVRIAQ